MTLAGKIDRLNIDAVAAKRLADFWQRQIDVYGEAKATAFYKHLGLNHLETKSVEWEGLKLSREPNEVEKLCIKSISQAQDAGKASIVKILSGVRLVLIDAAMKAIKKLTPATYHELILTARETDRVDVRAQLDRVFENGRKLVAFEIVRQKGKSVVAGNAFYKQAEEDKDALDSLADLTNSRVANDIQSRVTAAASRFTLLGLTGKALWDAVQKEVGEGSTGWLERASQGVANKVLNMGRSAEAEDRKDEWERVEYSAILDTNVCSPCSLDDGQTSTNEADLSPAPNPECEGGDWCRCAHIYIVL
jgi:hypothetical protein